MAKPGKDKPDEPEILPDAWERFERAIDVVIKSGPKHKKTDLGPKSTPKSVMKPKERPASKGRVHKGKAGQ